MTLSFEILGGPGRDNAAFVRINSGQAIQRLLFDCGEGCLATLSMAERQAIDHLLFSHLHMDHVAGFDSFFRANYARDTKPVLVWGPPRTAEIMHHRMRGFMWNLIAGAPGLWQIHDVHPSSIMQTSIRARDAFARAYQGWTRPFDGLLIDEPGFTVTALTMDHRTPSLAYVVREKPRWRVDPARLAALGLLPGPWLQLVKAPQPTEAALIEIEGIAYELQVLREQLLVEFPGESLAYLTDFLLDAAAFERLVPALKGCGTLICESQYRHNDLALALRNYHMTTTQAAELARRANAGQLILFHLSDRYHRPDWLAMLQEARAIFPNTHVSERWQHFL